MLLGRIPLLLKSENYCIAWLLGTVSKQSETSAASLFSFSSSQLFYDGYQSIAHQLHPLIKSPVPCPPSDRLNHLVAAGLKAEGENKEEDSFVPINSGLDLDFDSESQPTASEPSYYETVYVTSHKGSNDSCRIIRDYRSRLFQGLVELALLILKALWLRRDQQTHLSRY